MNESHQLPENGTIFSQQTHITSLKRAARIAKMKFFGYHVSKLLLVLLILTGLIGIGSFTAFAGYYSPHPVKKKVIVHAGNTNNFAGGSTSHASVSNNNTVTIDSTGNNGNHYGQIKNGNNGKHKGQNKIHKKIIRKKVIIKKNVDSSYNDYSYSDNSYTDNSYNDNSDYYSTYTTYKHNQQYDYCSYYDCNYKNSYDNDYKDSYYSHNTNENYNSNYNDNTYSPEYSDY